jgi:hypothetical protein
MVACGSLRLLRCLAHAAVVAEAADTFAGSAVVGSSASLAHFQEILTGPVHAAAVGTGLISGIAAGARVPSRSASLAIANQSCSAVRVPVAESASWGEGTADATGAGHSRLTIRSAGAVAPGRRRSDAGSKFGTSAVRHVAIAMQALGAGKFRAGARTTLGTGTLTGTCREWLKQTTGRFMVAKNSGVSRIVAFGRASVCSGPAAGKEQQ